MRAFVEPEHGAIIQDQSALHDFDRVTKVRLETGILSCVEPEALAFCFVLVTLGTLADGATLEIVTFTDGVGASTARSSCP